MLESNNTAYDGYDGVASGPSGGVGTREPFSTKTKGRLVRSGVMCARSHNQGGHLYGRTAIFIAVFLSICPSVRPSVPRSVPHSSTIAARPAMLPLRDARDYRTYGLLRLHLHF